MTKVVKIAISISIFFICSYATASFAQGNTDITNPNGLYTPAGTAPPQGAPPPPGDGTQSANTIPGDKLKNTQPVPRGNPSSSPKTGTNFPTQTLSPAPRVNVTVDEGPRGPNEPARGSRIPWTFQPNEIPSSKLGQVESKLGLAAGTLTNASTPYQNITASPEQIEAAQNVLNPPAGNDGMNPMGYRGKPMPDDTIRGKERTVMSYISKDHPGPSSSRYSSSNYARLNPIDPVRFYSRYLVKKGVVVACIELIIAACFMIFGHQYAGSKAIIAGGGLMLLLMAYTIWKIDMFNTLNARGPGQAVNLAGSVLDGSAPDSFDPYKPNPVTPDEQVLQSHTYEGDYTLSEDTKNAQSGGGNKGQANLPIANSFATNRSGLTLSPLGAQH